MRFETETTRAAGDAERIAAQAGTSHECVVAAGGDGTVHEVANGLLRAGDGTRARAALGVLPLGSGDDFHKLLGAGDPIERLARGRIREFDAGRIVADGGTRHFANGMDIGFGAHGAANVRRVPRFLKGFGAYLGALVLTMVDYPLLRVRLQLDDEPPRETSTAMTAAMNGTTFGGSFRVCPAALPDDGLLDVLEVGPVDRLGILGLVPKILQGAHGSDPRVALRTARRLRIEAESPLLVEADGEIAFEAARRLEVEALPRALKVVS